ncbi:HpcH/HpaI aldolase/citrate lyase family protein [Blastococcus sp. SYSU DS0619]
MGQAAAPPPGRPDVATARSWLFVPGDRADRFARAVTSGADVVVCDLEDAVAPEAKAGAREEVARWLRADGAACVRINAHGTAWHDDDVAALAGARGLAAVLVPKAEDPERLTATSERLGPGTAVVALVESALGVHRAHELAAAPGVARLAFGSIDLALDLGTEDAALPLLLARSTLVLASRVAGRPAPVDGVTARVDDLGAVQEDTSAAVAMGFGGKLCVHPRQVAVVNAGFRPGEDEVRSAEQVVAAAASGSVVRLDGRMIDRPVVERARQVLRRAGIDPDAPAPGPPAGTTGTT